MTPIAVHMMLRGIPALALLVATLLARDAVAAEPPKPEQPRERGWFNSTELSVVYTTGNSDTETTGFKNTIRRRQEISTLRLKLDAVRSDTADEPYALVDPDGPHIDPGTGLAYSIVHPPKELDVEKYFVEARYDRKFTARRTWNVGATWDRNKDAGILNRYVTFAGLGNVWMEKKESHLKSSYSLSYTEREEETPDPLKDERFAGAHVALDYVDLFGKLTTFQHSSTTIVSLRDTSDYSLDMTNSVSVSLSKRLSLKVSLQWLYNNEPALEEVDLVAIVFSQELGQDVTVEIGETDIRKEQLDTVFRTSLVIDF